MSTKQSGRGGRRPGAGRKVGGINNMTRKAFAAAQASGEAPQFLLRVSRGKVVGGVKPTFSHRIDAANTVLPFLMPKLSAVAMKATPAYNP